MRWTVESSKQRDLRKNTPLLSKWKHEREWHLWFAWHPVNVAPDRKAWLTTVERRLGYLDREREPKWWTWDIRRFEYRDPTLPNGGG